MAYIERTDEELLFAFLKGECAGNHAPPSPSVKISPAITSISDDGACSNCLKVRKLLVGMIRDYCKRINRDPLEFVRRKH